MDGFNTFEKQDKILLGENGTPEAAAAALILRQQGFAVQSFTVSEPADTAALLTALAEKAAELDCAFIATAHYARTETDADGACRILPAVDADADQSTPCCAPWTRRCWRVWCCPWASSRARMCRIS